MSWTVTRLLVLQAAISVPRRSGGGGLGVTLNDLGLPPRSQQSPHRDISRNRRCRRAPAHHFAQSTPTRRASHQSRLVGAGRNSGTQDTTPEERKRFAAAATAGANCAPGAPRAVGSSRRHHSHTLNKPHWLARTRRLPSAAQASAHW